MKRQPPIPTLPCFKCGVPTNETQSIYGVGHYKCFKKAKMMTKYLVTFLRNGSKPFAMIEVYAPNFDELDFFMRRFYPDTNWDYEVIE